MVWKTSLVVVLAVAAAVAVYALFFTAPQDVWPLDPEAEYNVVFIVADALRQDAPSCYGGEANTPNLDWLAENGVLFERAYSTSPWTAPSSVGMFTGNYATSYGYAPQMGSVQIYVPPGELLLAEVMHEAGYQTRNWVENLQASIHDNMQGFERLPEVDPFNHPVGAQIRDSLSAITGGEFYDTEGYKGSFEVLMYLLGLNREDHFFLHHWILDPHAPYRPVDEFKSRIKVKWKKLREFPGFYTTGVQGDREYNETELEYVKDLYLAEVESVDERVGYLLSVLRFKNLLDKTFIVFTSDHGELFGEHGLYGHGAFGRGCHYYEDLVRVPLLISGPAVVKGKRVRENVSTLDIMPTLKQLLNAAYEDGVQGKSLAPLLFGDAKREALIYLDDVREHEQLDALVDGHFKLICSGPDKFELYDLQRDPDEKNNLAASQARRVRAMFEKVKKIRAENKSRRDVNITALKDSVDGRSEAEKRRIMMQLRSLGYIK